MKECYAVIFSSNLSKDPDGYFAAASRMEELAKQQKGFLGIESARGEDGFGISVSYWEDEEAILAWKENAVHREIQKLGKEKWYSSYSLRVCRVFREYEFTKEPGVS
ncbi:MAG: antibiotic biosynthesis monooxygenase [Puniceicoccaceae bacterium]